MKRKEDQADLVGQVREQAELPLPGLVSVTPSRRTSPTGRRQAMLQKRKRSRKSRLYLRLSVNQGKPYSERKEEEPRAGHSYLGSSGISLVSETLPGNFEPALLPGRVFSSQSDSPRDIRKDVSPVFTERFLGEQKHFHKKTNTLKLSLPWKGCLGELLEGCK